MSAPGDGERPPQQHVDLSYLPSDTYVSFAQMGNCKVCGEHKDLRMGSCFTCSNFVDGETVVTQITSGL